jgi:hypothetical protein
MSTVATGDIIMTPTEQQRFNFLYEQHLTDLKLQGKQPATIDAYSRALRRVTNYFDRSPDMLTTDGAWRDPKIT